MLLGMQIVETIKVMRGCDEEVKGEGEKGKRKKTCGRGNK